MGKIARIMYIEKPSTRLQIMMIMGASMKGIIKIIDAVGIVCAFCFFLFFLDYSFHLAILLKSHSCSFFLLFKISNNFINFRDVCIGELIKITL